MTFDGYPIHSGDRVYDAAFGAGRVDHVDPVRDAIVVSFGSRTFSYNGEGYTPRFRQRTLFWQNPVIVNPRKGNEALWAATRRAAIAVHDSLVSDGEGTNV